MDIYRVFLWCSIGSDVIFVCWLATRQKTMCRALAVVPIAAIFPLFALHLIFPSEVIAAKIHWYFDLNSFLVKSMSLVVSTGLTVFGGIFTSWTVSVKWGHPRWFGVLVGVVIATLLLVPANLMGLALVCMSGDCL